MPRPTDSALRPSVDGLEGRFMLSAGIQRPAMHAPTSEMELLSLKAPWIASQQSTSATVTLTRQPVSQFIIQSRPPVISQGQFGDTLVVHVTTDDRIPDPNSRDLPTPSTPGVGTVGPSLIVDIDGPAIPYVHFLPVDEMVTFLPGESSKTITVTIIPGAENPGRLGLTLAAASMSGPSQFTVTPLVIDARPDAMTPTIVNSQLVIQGRKATGIAIQFNTPMDVASVTNPEAYRVTDDPHGSKAKDVSGFVMFPARKPRGKPVKIQSATWDASTNTVTLIPKGPLMQSGRYAIESRLSPDPKTAEGVLFGEAAFPLRDQAGNYLNDNGQSGHLSGGFGILSVSRRPSKPLAT